MSDKLIIRAREIEIENLLGLVEELNNRVVKYQELEKKLAKASGTLENIEKYNWSGVGPSGCDTHNINHPCGPCAFDNKGWKTLARQTLAELSKNETDTE